MVVAARKTQPTRPSLGDLIDELIKFVRFRIFFEQTQLTVTQPSTLPSTLSVPSVQIMSMTGQHYLFPPSGRSASIVSHNGQVIICLLLLYKVI